MSNNKYTIPPNTSLGPIALTVSDLDRSLNFYRQALGFQVHDMTERTARLGSGTGGDILILVENSNAPRVEGRTGVYHFAILVPSRLELARSFQRLLDSGWPLSGFGDHEVSEAIYLSDPDRIGIEIYRDRPRDEWPVQDGEVQMTTRPLDIDSLTQEMQGSGGVPPALHAGAVLGHVHLKVADLEAAESFYHGVLGFELMQRYGRAASFVSAGGYHHHIGFNTWESKGAKPPPSGAAGLRYFTIRMPTANDLEKLLKRIRQAGIPYEEDNEAGFLVRDPSGNSVRLTGE